MDKYLTFDEYQELGGTVPQSDFPNLEHKAQRKLDYFTQNRIKKMTTIPEEVKELLTIYVDRMSKTEGSENITSYSNGTESFSYAGRSSAELDNEYFRIAVEYLPIDLISQVVDDGN